MATCVICHGENASTYNLGSGETYRLQTVCKDCGKYDTQSGVWECLLAIDEEDRSEHSLLPYLAAHVRQATDAGEIVLLTPENWREFAEGHRSTPVSTKLQKLLESVARDSGIGQWVYLSGRERRFAATSDVRDQDELQFVLRHLNEADLIDYDEAIPPPMERRKPDGSYEKLEKAVRLTVVGWNSIAPVGSGIPNTVFVAMSFREELKDAYEHGMVPAIETDCKLRVVRIDRVRHNDNITNRIIAAIRSAQIVVADFTFQNQGVYYEAGFAEALGRTVIRTCRSDDFQQLHFDTRQFFHIKWTHPDDLRKSLADHIQATVTRRWQIGGV